MKWTERYYRNDRVEMVIAMKKADIFIGEVFA